MPGVIVRRPFLDGMAWLAAFLGVMSLLAVTAFHFPEYLTTPRLREVYAEHQVRGLLRDPIAEGYWAHLVAPFRR